MLEMLQCCDDDNSGEVDFAEFIEVICNLDNAKSGGNNGNGSPSKGTNTEMFDGAEQLASLAGGLATLFPTDASMGLFMTGADLLDSDIQFAILQAARQNNEPRLAKSLKSYMTDIQAGGPASLLCFLCMPSPRHGPDHGNSHGYGHAI